MTDKPDNLAASAIERYLKSAYAPDIQPRATKPELWSDPAWEIAADIWRPKLQVEALANRLNELELPDIEFLVAVHRQVKEGQ